MKTKIILLMFIVASSLLTPTRALSNEAGKTQGLGVILGEPTGFTGKFWTDSTHAIDVGIAFSFNDFFLFYSDYLFHFPGAFRGSSDVSRQLEPYVGIGGALFFTESSHSVTGHYYTSSSMGIGVRIPFGLELILTSAPIGFFAEIVPGVGLAPNTFGFFQGGIGARYYF